MLPPPSDGNLRVALPMGSCPAGARTGSDRQRAFRRRLPWLVGALGCLLTTPLAAQLTDTHSSYATARATGSATRTPALVPVGLATPKATAPQDHTITGLPPGGVTDRLVNIRNDGTLAVPAIDLSATATTATALDTDPVNGLTVRVDLCSTIWQQPLTNQPATCDGSTSTLLGPAPLSTLHAAAPGRHAAGLAALATLGVDHLRVRYGLPGTAPAGYAALTSIPRFTIWGTTVPGAPTGFTLAAGDTQLTAAWTAPANDGGAAVTGYTVTLNPGNLTCTTAGTTCTITGLTNGATYTAAVTATNNMGTSAASASATEIPYPAVMAPAAARVESWHDASDTSRVLTGAGTVATSGQSVQTWNDRSGNNRHVSQPTAANQMTVDAINGRQALHSSTNLKRYLSSTTGTFRTVVAIATPDTINKLHTLFASPAHGNISVRMLDNRIGSSGGTYNNPDDWSSSGTAWANSMSPAVGAVRPVPAGAGIWVAERAAPGIATDFSISTTYTSSGYTRGLVGRVGEVITFNTALTAAERRQVEEYLAVKWSVVLAPESPTAVTATAGTSALTASWTAPTATGGSPITGYTASATPAPGTCAATAYSCTVTATCTTAATSCTITGLTAGTSYTVTVVAHNAVAAAPLTGGSVRSAASNAVVPVSAPSAPTGFGAIGGLSEVTASWTASPATGLTVTYTVTASPGGATCTTTGTSCTVTGLAHGTAYTLSATATNSLGTSAASATANATTAAVPGAPSALSATPGTNTATVGWAAPASNGGTAVTGYSVTATPADGTLATATCSTAGATTCGLTGLTNGAPYTVTVTATNAVGTGGSPTGIDLVSHPSFFVLANLSGWFDASSTATLLTPTSTVATGGQKVQTVNDRSGNNRHAAQATAANQMTVSTLNGRQALLSGSQTSYVSVDNTGSFRTLVVAASQDTSRPWNTLFALAANADHSMRLNTGYLPTASGPTSIDSNDWANGTGPPTHSWVNSVAASSAAVPTGIFVAEAAANRTNSFSLSSNFTHLGLGRGLTGALGEVLGFNRVLTPAERRESEEYLSRKWSIAVTPQAPTITAVTKPAGGSLTVTWTAPAWAGGSAVTGYTVTATAGKTCTAAAGATSCTVTGLTGGVVYPVTMTATNAVGVGVTSTAFNGTA